MGLRGQHAKTKVITPDDVRARANGQRIRKPKLSRSERLSRADRVIAFLETLPITKGIYAGKR